MWVSGFGLGFQDVADVGEELFFFCGWWRGGGRGGSLFFLHQCVHGLDDQKNRDGNNKEADYVVEEGADVDVDTGIQNLFGGFIDHLVLERDFDLGEIDAADEEADGGHDDVFDDGVDDGAEGTTDDNADGEVDGVSFESEFLEFRDDTHVKLLSLRRDEMARGGYYFKLAVKLANFWQCIDSGEC
jgi:hypothetical protein